MKRNPDYLNYTDPDPELCAVFQKALQNLVYQARDSGIRLHTEPVNMDHSMGAVLDVPVAGPLRIGFPKGPK